MDIAISILNQSSYSANQKKELLRFLELMRIGKAGKKKVGNHRLISYVYGWVKLYRYFRKDMDRLTEADIEKFYKDLERDKIKQLNGKPYKPNSKNELIKALKRYFGYKIEDVNKYKKMVGWIKEYTDIPIIPAISKEEAEKVAKSIDNLRDRALFFFLFDSGCRIEEALNIKIGDVQKHERKEKNDFFYLVDIRVSKTLPRRISIPLSSRCITDWLREHPERSNPDACLFPIKYDASRKMMKIATLKVLGFKVTPHQLRHSSATYYCKKIDNPYKFCYRYGWKFGSKEANRYIDRNLLGDEEQEKLTNIIENDKIEGIEKEFEAIRKENKTLWGKVDDVASANTILINILLKSGLKPQEIKKQLGKLMPDGRLPRLSGN